MKRRRVRSDQNSNAIGSLLSNLLTDVSAADDHLSVTVSACRTVIVSCISSASRTGCGTCEPVDCVNFELSELHCSGAVCTSVAACNSSSAAAAAAATDAASQTTSCHCRSFTTSRAGNSSHITARTCIFLHRQCLYSTGSFVIKTRFAFFAC